MDARAIEDLIYKQSGLLGVSGMSSDMRTLLASDDAAAHASPSICSPIASGASSARSPRRCGGIDALVFTAGIGEHSCRDARARLPRRRVARRRSSIRRRTQAGGPRISTPASAVPAWVIPTNEELMIARHTLQTTRRAQ